MLEKTLSKCRTILANRRRRAVLAGVLLLIVVSVCAFWYQPRQSRLRYERAGDRYFAFGELDSAVASYERAMKYGNLSESADVMYRLALTFREDTTVMKEYYDLGDSIGPKLRE
ncbi:MAG: hypothetical protein NTX17_07660 [Candidatus Eisenbacteria bacterium]|nr:hypothetical protein [Candidatus Eisenbacteria bacterium]